MLNEKKATIFRDQFSQSYQFSPLSCVESGQEDSLAVPANVAVRVLSLQEDQVAGCLDDVRGFATIANDNPQHSTTTEPSVRWSIGGFPWPESARDKSRLHRLRYILLACTVSVPGSVPTGWVRIIGQPDSRVHRAIR